MSVEPSGTLADPLKIIAELRRELDEARAEQDKAQRKLNERTTERDEALARENAMAEVLQVINSSPGDLTLVFDAILDKALDLCDAAFGILLTYDGERFHHAAQRSIPAAFVEFMREHPPIYGPESGPGRLALGERLVHVHDVTDTDLYRSGDPNRRAIADLAGARTLVTVALRKDGGLVGAIAVFRQEVHPFSDKQIALLENFAAQGVIAIESARLLTETRDALRRETATAEVLRVINASPGEIAPVFDAILEKAMSLCGIAFGSLQLYEEGKFRAVALRGVAQTLAELLRQPIEPIPGAPNALLLGGEAFLHIADRAEIARQLPNDPRAQAYVADGLRTVLFVSLRKEGDLLGYIAVYRKEVRLFTQEQIALLQNFAAQAVIAMENARLLNELRERTRDL